MGWTPPMVRGCRERSLEAMDETAGWGPSGCAGLHAAATAAGPPPCEPAAGRLCGSGGAGVGSGRGLGTDGAACWRLGLPYLRQTATAGFHAATGSHRPELRPLVTAAGRTGAPGAGPLGAGWFMAGLAWAAAGAAGAALAGAGDWAATAATAMGPALSGPTAWPAADGPGDLKRLADLKGQAEAEGIPSPGRSAKQRPGGVLGISLQAHHPSWRPAAWQGPGPPPFPKSPLRRGAAAPVKDRLSLVEAESRPIPDRETELAGWLVVLADWLAAVESITALPFGCSGGISRRFARDFSHGSAVAAPVGTPPGPDQGRGPARTRWPPAAAAKGSRRSCRGCACPRSSARGAAAGGGLGAHRVQLSGSPGCRGVDVRFQLAFFSSRPVDEGTVSRDQRPSPFQTSWPKVRRQPAIAELVARATRSSGPGPPADPARR